LKEQLTIGSEDGEGEVGILFGTIGPSGARSGPRPDSRLGTARSTQ
jgi:hypothetical protein